MKRRPYFPQLIFWSSFTSDYRQWPIKNNSINLSTNKCRDLVMLTSSSSFMWLSDNLYVYQKSDAINIFTSHHTNDNIDNGTTTIELTSLCNS